MSAKSLPPKAQSIRRSERTNKGQPPSRFVIDMEEKQIERKGDEKREERSTKNKNVMSDDQKSSSNVENSKSMSGKSIMEDKNSHIASSSKTKSSALSSAMRRKQLELDLEQERRLAEIEMKQMELRKEVIKKEIALKKAELDEKCQSSRASTRASTKKSYVDDVRTVTSKSSYVQRWVNSMDDFHPSNNAQEDIKVNKFMARQTFSKDLPTFSGEPGEWMNFITQFNDSSRICEFSNSENIIRLQRSLRGRAKESVNALLSFTQEVDEIIKTLQNRFGRPETIIQDLIESAVKIPIMREDKLSNIFDFSIKVKNLAVTLKSLKGQEYLSNPQLLNDLIDKLTPALKMEWGRKIVEKKKSEAPGELITIMDFSEWLEENSEAAMYVTNPTREYDRRKKYVCTTSLQDEKPILKCKFCKKEGHKVEKCDDFKKLDVESRWEWVKKSRVCFSCLTSSHITKSCRLKKICGINECSFKHHHLLHKEMRREPQQTILQQHQVSCQVNNSEFHEVLLRIAPVEIIGPEGRISTYALFDEGSTVTMLDEAAAMKIGAVGPTETLKTTWMNSMTSEVRNSMRITISIKGQNSDTEYVMSNVRTVCNLCLPVQTVNMKNIAKKCNYINQVDLPSLVNAKPLILIGQDNIDLIIAREVYEGGKNLPILSKSKLGWVVHGNIQKHHAGRIDEFSLFVHHENDDLHELVKNSFEIDNLGIVNCQNPQSSSDKRAAEILEKTTRRINSNRWETGLLWKSDDVLLPNNKKSAMNRLLSIEKKMDRDAKFAEEYEKKISSYVQKNYAKKLTPMEVKQHKKNKWYLPHFAVINSNKPGKIRFVFDAAAKTMGISLNDVLLKGPDLLNSLLGVMFKFRQRNIAFTGDIMEMFHQVQIIKEDTCCQRFLWRGRERNREPDEYEMMAMTFGSVSSPTSAQYVMRRNAMEFENEFPEATRAITDLHYMDDYLDSVDTVEAAKIQIANVIEVHRRGGFVIRNWTSNSKEVLKSIPEELRSLHSKNMDLEEATALPIERILGLMWDPNKDEFSFSMKWNETDLGALADRNDVTKREVLKIVMSIFDPFGFLGNFTIRARILLQEIWRQKTDWDDVIEPVILKKWKSWVKEIHNIASLSFPRCYIRDVFKVKEIQLHIFCDASAKAFSAVAYFRFKIDGFIKTSFIMAKTRVSPLKPMSIPRLELQAAVLGSRLSVTIQESHNIEINNCFYWTDSRNVLSWLKTDATIFKPFVAHRVAEITETSDSKQWNWVSTKENVADEATRDEKYFHCGPENRWMNGPDFLKLDAKDWPSTECTEFDTTEIKKRFVGVSFTEVSLDACESLPEIARFSSWLKLVRTTAWMLRFTNKAKKKSQCNSELIPAEINTAESLWIKYVQLEDFYEEIQDIKEVQHVESSSRLYKLSPMLCSEGILRVKSRIIYSADLGEDTKYPIILDPKNRYTKLLISHYHKQANHNGQSYVVNELRQRFWILNVRSAVRSSWSSCQWCKNRRIQIDVPEMSPLPASRLQSFVRPFTITGMDYFGPLLVTVGRRKEKRYGVIFTCMSTRGVHLELAHSLSTDSAIMTIRRFIGRRGCPKKIFSDNGTNLRGAENELRKSLQELDQDKVILELTSKNIEWHFISPLAPHMGGSWERLIKSIKLSLAAVLKEKAPREEVLQTLLVEAENIVNSRPLVHVSLDHADDEALTPNHFILGSSSSAQTPGTFDESDILGRKHWRISQLLADHFWRRWIKEYLPVLTKRTKWFRSSKRQIKVNDVVILIDGDFCRNTWPKGIVTSVYPGTDGNIRVVDVKTATGTFKRPLVKLCILDVEPHEE